MSPRMRPSSTRRSRPSSAMVLPKALRRPRASMHAMASALPFFFGFRWCRLLRRPAGWSHIQKFFRLQSEPVNGGVDPGPFFRKKFLAFAPQQQIARACINEHAATSLTFDQLLVHQLLVALQNREVIHPIFGRDITHRRQRIAFFEHAVKYHGDHAIAQLAVNRLIVVPLMIHYGFRMAVPREVRGIASNRPLHLLGFLTIHDPTDCVTLGAASRWDFTFHPP